MLFLQQVQEVRGRADAQEPLDGIQDDVASALRTHANRLVLLRYNRRNVTRNYRRTEASAAPPRQRRARFAGGGPTDRAAARPRASPSCTLTCRSRKTLGVEEALELVAGSGADRLDHRAALAPRRSASAIRARPGSCSAGATGRWRRAPRTRSTTTAVRTAARRACAAAPARGRARRRRSARAGR